MLTSRVEGVARLACVVVGVVAVALLTGCSQSVTPGSGTSAGAAVTVVTAGSADEQALVQAFDKYERFQTCVAETVGGTVRIATITSTGESWAIAGFAPSANCVFKQVDYRTGLPTLTIPPTKYGPFSEVPGPPMGVFQRPGGGPWTMNSEAGFPFPCPLPGGKTPGGVGNPSLPSEVLQAWGIPYAQNCADQIVPTGPGR